MFLLINLSKYWQVEGQWAMSIWKCQEWAMTTGAPDLEEIIYELPLNIHNFLLLLTLFRAN